MGGYSKAPFYLGRKAGDDGALACIGDLCLMERRDISRQQRAHKRIQTLETSARVDNCDNTDTNNMRQEPVCHAFVVPYCSNKIWIVLKSINKFPIFHVVPHSISHRIISYHNKLYHIMSCCIVSYHTITYHNNLLCNQTIKLQQSVSFQVEFPLDVGG